MDKTIKIVAVLCIIVIIGCTAFFLGTSGQSPVKTIPVLGATGSSGNVTVYFFYGEECPHCHNVMPFLQNLSAKYPDVDFKWLEVWHNQTNAAFFNSLNTEFGQKGVAVPEIITGNVVLIGERDIPAKLENAILDQLKKKQ
jgi:thiol-disulfide isomerase/thioredoxin